MSDIPMPLLGKSLEDTLGIRTLLAREDGLAEAELVVTERCCQPFGMVHGGVNLALAENLAGHGSMRICAPGESVCGMHVSGSHVAPAPLGSTLHATARLLHRGRKTHLWNVDITCGDTLVSTVRVTNFIIRPQE